MRHPARCPAVPVAAGVLLAVTACSAAATSSPPASSVTQSPDRAGARLATAAAFTALAFPARAAGCLLGATGLPPDTGPSRAEVWHTATAGATWQVQWEGSGTPLSISAPDPGHGSGERYHC
jgi:hypothetical protein